MMMKIAGPVVVVTLAAFAFASSKSHLAEVAKANNFNPDETAAFDACNTQTARMRITINTGRGGITSNVPDSVCVCQAREMARVFKPGEYGDHHLIADYLINKSGAQELGAAHIRPGEGSATSQFSRLLTSFKTCADKYGVEEAARSEELRRQNRPRS